MDFICTLRVDKEIYEIRKRMAEESLSTPLTIRAMQRTGRTAPQTTYLGVTFTMTKIHAKVNFYLIYPFLYYFPQNIDLFRSKNLKSHSVFLLF